MSTTILVIEDEAEIQANIAEILGYEGMACLVAPDGETGVQIARKAVPDLILCDVMMPGINGHEVLAALQGDPPTAAIPFVFLTAKADHASRRHGMDLGADDYLTKPFTSAELLTAITTRLQKRARLTYEYAKPAEDLRDVVIEYLPHELQTPLTGILSGAEMLLANAPLLEPDDLADLATIILESGKRLQRLIQNYLLYAQLQSLRLDPDWPNVQPQARTDGPGIVIREVAEAIAAKEGRLDDLVVNAREGVAGISSEHLKKIVEELVDNACKFSSSRTQVAVSAGIHEQAYVLSVSDHGRGMSREQIKRVGALMQFGRKLYEQQGSGLGLAIVHQLTQIYGGDLSIESVPDRGTSIVVRVPCGT
jgi:two-component system sensor histidine kinase/response regulator